MASRPRRWIPGSLTGRENVKFVARLYAKQEELKEKIEFVEEFAELGKYLICRSKLTPQVCDRV
ncbi:hypothetical protein MUTS15_60370 [Escherichia coli]|nr:hypothetical protein MUTS15_60370 [Escherichia coli]